MQKTNRAQKESTKTAVSSVPTTQPLTPKMTFTLTINRDVWERFKAITPKTKTMYQAVEDLITEKVIKAEM